ncbi:MAG: hypothetical protein M0009_14135 [Deltaproteobacteria bacterium]|nr:hypothetical protein [Deltaproteobacteria bacterium]
MNTATGIVVIFGIMGMLLIAAACRFAMQRKQLSSGRNIGRFPLHREDEGNYVFNDLVTITGQKKWCRLLLSFKLQGTYQIDMTPRYFFKPAALVMGTPFILTISDAAGRVLYREEDTLARFLAWLGGRGGSRGTFFSEQGRGIHEGRITLLEFLPGHSGLYRISLNMQSRVEGKAPGASSYCELLEAELTVKEDVIPLSKTVKYPHKRVHI